MTVRIEIEKRLKAWADAQVPPIPVAIENINFTKPTSGCYVEVEIIGGNSENANLAAEGIRDYGMFQITCCAPSNTGMGKVEAMARALRTVFPVVPKTGELSIESPLSWSGKYEDGPFVCLPVTGKYRVEN